ncbi:sortase domain-containing protein [Amycolatopsis nigrescens]|uniref:sortase domain-containing protein n=1 Tax=Amycolatopsis nigrescens TaxID=381445 RepID=UPI0007C5916D|nr:sortase [Amycolatopsis nigrescens]
MSERSDRRTDFGRLAAAAAAVVVALSGVLAGAAMLLSRDTPVTALPGASADGQAAAGAVRAPGNPGTGLAPANPAALEIPAIGVATGTLVELGRTPAGTMEVPGDARSAGWYTTAPVPGEIGTAVIAGHVEYARARGVFRRLHELHAGDTVTVHRQDGTRAAFTVYRVDAFPKTAVPPPASTDAAELRLVTCSGAFDGSSADTVVVSARLDGLTGPDS